MLRAPHNTRYTLSISHFECDVQTNLFISLKKMGFCVYSVRKEVFENALF